MRGSKRLKKFKNKTEVTDDGDGNWLVSYADMMTLLWGFFVIISAFSVPSKDLIEKLKESTATAMGGEYQKPFNEITNELESVLKELNLENDAKVETLTDGVKITVKSNNFFESGSTNLSDPTKEVLTKIGTILKKQNNTFKILVEGHTDDVPVKKELGVSNWELSSNRAASVVKLFESIGVKHELLRPVGFADVEPLVSTVNLQNEELAKARSQNRRIVIRLQKTEAPRMEGVH